MVESSPPIEIPKRALFKAADVCSLVNVKPYVLRSWEIEFPDLGVAKSAGGPRVYRRADVEQVMRIKHLLLVDGLTLAGARRRLEEEGKPVVVDAPIEALLGQNTRECLTEIKHGLRAILDLLAGRQADQEFALRAPITAVAGPPRRSPQPRDRRPGRKQTSSRSRQVTRRKRSA